MFRLMTTPLLGELSKIMALSNLLFLICGSAKSLLIIIGLFVLSNLPLLSNFTRH